MALLTGNKIFTSKNKPDKVLFSITEQVSFKDYYDEYINGHEDGKPDISGLLLEHKRWYEHSGNMNFDPRVYLIIRGVDNNLYGISFRDKERIEENLLYNYGLGTEFEYTKIVNAEELCSDYVTAKPLNISHFISDPINICGFDHTNEKKDEDCHGYYIRSGCFLPLQLMAGIYKLKTEGINKVVLSVDRETYEKFSYFYFVFLFGSDEENKYRPIYMSSYVSEAPDFIAASPSDAKIYEENGYRLVEIIRNKDENKERGR